jgi:hypothetical protein
MDTGFWTKVLGLVMANPELLIALLYVFGFLFMLMGGAASLAWYLRGVWAKGEIRNLESLVRLVEAQLSDANQKIVEATLEVESHKPKEESSTSWSKTIRSLNNATTSNDLALHIIEIYKTGR